MCVAGAVNHNLQGMKQRVNGTLTTFEGVTRALQAATEQLTKDQALAVCKCNGAHPDMSLYICAYHQARCMTAFALICLGCEPSLAGSHTLPG